MSSAEVLYKALGGKPASDGYMCHCPSHVDKTPSLSVTEKNGTLLFNCHAGCSQESVLKELKLRNLLPKKKKLTTSITESKYNSEESDKTLISVREDHPDGTKNIYRKPKGFTEKLEPYRYSKWKDAGKEELIFHVEGEKCVHILEKNGFSATTTIGGSSSFKLHYEKYYKGRNVCILTDNDATGRKYGNKVYKGISKVASSCKIVELSELKEGEDVHDYLTKYKKTPADLIGEIENSHSGNIDEDFSAKPIDISALGLHEIASQAEKIMAEKGANVYRRNSQIVKVITEKIKDSRGNIIDVSQLTEVNVDSMLDQLSQHVEFCKFDKRSKTSFKVKPPNDVAKIMRSRSGHELRHFRPIVGTTSVPLLRKDGTLVNKVGYDPVSNTFVTSLPKMPQIPDHPTKSQSLEALGDLNTLLDEIPFESDASNTVALAQVISAVCRNLVDTVPMTIISSPSAGTGKSFFADLVSMIATGQRCSGFTVNSNGEEVEKRVSAALLSGQYIILFDNVSIILGGDILCAAIERPYCEIRPLGVSKLVRVENRAIFMATGINLSVKGDLARRTLRCSLDSSYERPELRAFKKDPIGMISIDRGKYVAACLTIVKGYISAGLPDIMPPLNSFNEWSTYIRSALVWLGCADPCDTMDEIRADDPETSQLKDVILAWKIAIGINNPKTAAQICHIAGNGKNTNFYDSLKSCVTTDEKTDFKKLAYWLRRVKGRVLGGVKIIGVRDRRTNQTLWSLQTIIRSTGDAGLSGDDSPSSVVYGSTVMTLSHEGNDSSPISCDLRRSNQNKAILAPPADDSMSFEDYQEELDGNFK